MTSFRPSYRLLFGTTRLQESGKVKVGGRHFFPCHGKAGIGQGLAHNAFFVQIRARGFGRPGKEFADLFQQFVVPRFGGKGNQDAVLGQAAQVLNHFRHFFVGIMNGHVNARDRVVRSGDGLQIGGEKFGVRYANGLGPTFGFFGHGGRNIRGGHFGSHFRQGNGQTTHATTTIADGLSLNVAVLLDPVQNLLNGLVVAVADIQLDRVDIIGFGINLVPSVKAFCIKVFTDFGLVVDGALEQGGRRRRRMVVHRHKGGNGGKTGPAEKKNRWLHGCDRRLVLIQQ